MRTFGITHDCGTLRRVLVHHPGKELELANLNPIEHNFDRPVDVEKFVRQHKDLMDALVEAGVEVIDVGTVVKSDKKLSSQVALAPNLVFTRDSSIVTDVGAILMRMGLPSRRRETPIIKFVYEALDVPLGLELKEPETFEGGGFAQLDGRVAVAGLCSRTTKGALDEVRRFLFGNDIVDTFMVLNLPPDDIHIDGDFAELPGHVALIHRETLEHAPAKFHTRTMSWESSFTEWLEVNGWDIIEMSDRERSDMAANFLVIDHDLAIHYEGNPRIMKEVKESGMEVVQIPGEELRKGNGGVHCMTCPLLRDI